MERIRTRKTLIADAGKAATNGAPVKAGREVLAEFREKAKEFVRQESVTQLTEYLEESQDVERTRQLLADYNKSLKGNGIIEIPEEEIGIEAPEEEGTDE